MTRSNVVIATAQIRWILHVRARAQLRLTSASYLRVRKRASIATRASRTTCQTCATSPGGSSSLQPSVCPPGGPFGVSADRTLSLAMSAIGT